MPASNRAPVAEPPVTLKKHEIKTPVSGMQAAVIVHLPQVTSEVAWGTKQRRHYSSAESCMLGDITVVDQIYIACGYTDLR